MRLIMVEDDEYGDVVVEALKAQGHQVDRLRRGQDLLTSHGNYDAVVLDLRLPDIDGLQVLRKLRQVSSVPVVILADDSSEHSVVRSLRNGADDYVAKPARLHEFTARLEAMTRRRTAAEVTHTTVVTDDIRIDLAARRVEVDGKPVALTPKEFELVRVLVEQPGIAVSKQQLMDRIWGDAFVARSRSLSAHIRTLRIKLDRPGVIRTIHGYGYRWEWQPTLNGASTPK